MTLEAATHAKSVELGKHILRMTTAAGSGHPSSALAIIHIVVELMYRTMRFDPGDPWNPDQDRLVLSIGHAVPAIYAAYADLGGVIGIEPSTSRPLTVDDLGVLRALKSELDGHPNPAEGFPFFDAATGSLGQGLSVAAGLALAARLDRSDRRVFVIMGDGESREGQVWEAADFAAERGLDAITAVISCNGHGQAGPVSIQQSADRIAAKFEAFGWSVVQIDGHAPIDVKRSLESRSPDGRPRVVVAKTVKGWGVDLMQSENYHGKPVPPGRLDEALRQLDATGRRLGASSNVQFPSRRESPARPTDRPTAPIPPIRGFAEAATRCGLAKALTDRRMATRVAYGVALTALGNVDDRIVVLDGDVSNSTYANLFAAAHPDRYFECKIAEQNMITTAVGLAAAGRIPLASSFAKFIARGVDQLDMAAITRANVKIVGSHSGVSLAADGPSQMAVSDVAYFRSLTGVDAGRGTPACRMFQPSDAISAYRCTELMARLPGMSYLRTHRPEAPFIYPIDEPFSLSGFKQLRTGSSCTLVTSGYMLHSVLAAADQLKNDGLTVNVFDVYLFPFDPGDILETARGTNSLIVTVEDNYSGGLHAAMAEAASVLTGVQVHGLTVRRIPKSARSADELFDYVGVGLNEIVRTVRGLVDLPVRQTSR